MPLRFTNTLTGRKEDFQPLHPPHVTLYVCGVTVYDHCHIGHARGAVVFDVLHRTLKAKGYPVTYVRNVTDVDDKIIQRALSERGQDLKRAAQLVAKKYEQSFREDFGRLGLLAPTQEPRATEFIPKMVQSIQALIQNGVAYEGSDGVYFSVRKSPPYGQLSHQNPDQMLEGVRIESGEGKKDPLDFALWKKAKPEEPSWPSPWGEGRPGWHIECSTMSTDILGDTFDIHGGGQDLIFPHHENERAQALGAGKPFAKVWLHNGLLTVNGQKMSKSVGNIIPIQQALKRHPADVLRMFFLSAHYRSPLDFTWERLDEAAHAYERLTVFLAHADALGPGQSISDDAVQKWERSFHEAMEDDLNIPEALANLYGLVSGGSQHLQGMVSDSSRNKGREACVRAYQEKIRKLGQQLGFFGEGASSEDQEQIRRLMVKRDEARRKKDYATSDRIRQQLLEQGYVVEDTSGKTVVRKKV